MDDQRSIYVRPAESSVSETGQRPLYELPGGHHVCLFAILHICLVLDPTCNVGISNPTQRRGQPTRPDSGHTQSASPGPLAAEHWTSPTDRSLSDSSRTALVGISAPRDQLIGLWGICSPARSPLNPRSKGRGVEREVVCLPWIWAALAWMELVIISSNRARDTNKNDCVIPLVASMAYDRCDDSASSDAGSRCSIISDGRNVRNSGGSDP